MTVAPPLVALLEDLRDEGRASAAAALIGIGEEAIAVGTTGVESTETGARATPATLFDLASLTKTVVGTLALTLHRDGALPLETRVGDVVAESPSPLARATLEDLLRHRSGLRAWAPLWELGADREAALRWILSDDAVRGGRSERYSDLGYVLWGWIAERVTETPLGELVRRRVADPLGGTLVPAPGDRSGVAECRLSNERETELAAEIGIDLEVVEAPARGSPQDGNARFLGGLPGHAGLFGDLAGLHRLAAEWLAPGRVLDPGDVVRALEGDGDFLLGWWTARRGARAGAALGPRSYGMLGFVGGSLWVDPDRRLVAILVAHRTRVDVDLRPWRRKFHRLAATFA